MPGHPASFGDHTIEATTWSGGPTGVVIVFEGDGTLHEDGIGASQRTARNTLVYTPPRGPDHPQNYDALAPRSLYGDRIPLLQQLSANGTSRLRYLFDEPVDVALDLFVTDVDQSDSVVFRAFDAAGTALDMTRFTLASEGDLSSYKDTGTTFSEVVAPIPTTLFASDAITLAAVDDTNYNRSYGVLRSPANAAIGTLEITFSGTRNSPNRASGGNASHVYVALATAAPEPSAATLLAVGSLVHGFRARRAMRARNGSERGASAAGRRAARRVGQCARRPKGR